MSGELRLVGLDPTFVNLVKRLFKVPASIVLITGRMDSGKTDFALLLAEVCLETEIVKEVGTNIKVKDPRFTRITSVPALKSWLLHTPGPKLFILDEAGCHIDARRPMAKINKELRHCAFLLRKYRSKMILISQRGEDIESTFRAPDIWLATFKKTSKTTAICVSDLWEDPVVIEDIPRTSIKYDTYDIAPFSLEAQEDFLGAENLKKLYPVTWRFAMEDKSFEKIKHELGLSTRTHALKRCRSELKRLLRSLMEHGYIHEEYVNTQRGEVLP